MKYRVKIKVLSAQTRAEHLALSSGAMNHSSYIEYNNRCCPVFSTGSVHAEEFISFELCCYSCECDSADMSDSDDDYRREDRFRSKRLCADKSVPVVDVHRCDPSGVARGGPGGP